jgi:microcystin-dependent protein
LQEWWDSTGLVLGYVDNKGNIAIYGDAPDVFAQRLLMENSEFTSKFTKFTDDDTGAFVDVQYDIISSVPDPDYFARWRFGRDSIVDKLRLEVLQGDGTQIPAFDVETSTAENFTTVGSRRRVIGQAENMHEWRDEAGAVMSAIDKDGNFIGGPGGGGGGGQTPDNTGNVPVGAIMHWPLAPPSVGVEWLVCDGTSFLVADYPALHAYLGYTYGGAGLNFNVPDYRGNFLRMQDQGAGVDPQAGVRTNRGDGTTGDNPGTRQAQDVLATAIGAHTHLYLGVVGGGGLSGGGGFNGVMKPTGPAVGGGTGVETRPINVYTVIAIKAV